MLSRGVTWMDMGLTITIFLGLGFLILLVMLIVGIESGKLSLTKRNRLDTKIAAEAARLRIEELQTQIAVSQGRQKLLELPPGSDAGQ